MLQYVCMYNLILLFGNESRQSILMFDFCNKCQSPYRTDNFL